MPGSAITPATASEDETKYPPGFDKLLSLKHIFYCGWLAAIHGTYWGLIFAWTTFFGILRDGGDHKHLLVWFVGTALFLNCATKVWAHFENTPSMRIMIWHGYVFFSAGILCTLTAGVCRQTMLLRCVHVVLTCGGVCVALCRCNQLLLSVRPRRHPARRRLLVV